MPDPGDLSSSGPKMGGKDSEALEPFEIAGAARCYLCSYQTLRRGDTECFHCGEPTADRARWRPPALAPKPSTHGRRRVVQLHGDRRVDPRPVEAVAPANTATVYPPEPAPGTDVWLHTLTVLDRELPQRMLDAGRVVAGLATMLHVTFRDGVLGVDESESPFSSGPKMGGKDSWDLLLLRATLRDVQTGGGIKSKKQVEEGMADLVKAKYLHRLNPDAPRSQKAEYVLQIPAGFTPEGQAWNLARTKAMARARIEAAEGSAAWPDWFQEAWLTHRRYKSHGQWDPDFHLSWDERRGSIRNVGGAWVDIGSGEILSGVAA
jgi:hypothetical protein